MNDMLSNTRISLQAMNIPLEKRSLYTAVAVAKCVAYAQPIPTSKLESANEHYNTTILQNVEHTVAGVNEAMVLDVAMVLSLAYKFWLMRYRVCHEPSFVKANQLLANIAEVDRVSFAGIYQEVFTPDNTERVDRLVSAIGCDLEVVFQKVL